MSKNKSNLHKATGRQSGGKVITLADAAASNVAAQIAQQSAAPQLSTAQAYAGAWGSNGLFSPGTPQRPAYDMEDGTRVFDYMAGVNLYITPRSGYGLMPFTMLRNFADYCEEVRIVIEAFKREIRSMQWDIEKTDPRDKTDYNAEIKRLREFWTRPDGSTEFDAWLNACLEDVLVLDALTLWLEGSGDNITAVQQIDGATIRPLLDARGRVPMAPTPGYMQAIKGMNWTWFTSDYLMYLPFNAGINSPYGRSPTEYIITTINTSLQRKLSAMMYWNQTNIPEALVGLPDTMNVGAIQEFQDYFDALLAGNTDVLRRLKFLPTKSGTLPVHEFRRPEATTAMDEWVLKMASWAFGFLPSEFGIVAGAGLGGAGFLEGQENTMYRFGVGPIIQYIQNLITTIIRRQTKAPLGFKFVNIGPAEDKEIEARLDETQLRNGIIDINVLREKAGQQPIKNARPFIVVGNTPILLEDLFAIKPDPPAAVVVEPSQAQLRPKNTDDGDYINTSDEAGDEIIDGEVIKLALAQWKLKAQRRIKDRRPALCDPPDLCKGMLPDSVVTAVKSLLSDGAPGAVENAFAGPQLGAALARVALVKKKPLGNQHPTRIRDELEQDLSAALKREFKQLAAAAPAVDSLEAAQLLAAGAGDYWADYSAALVDVVTPLMERGALIGIDEARNNPLFQVEKMAKAAGDTAADPDAMASDTPPQVINAGHGGAASIGINWELINRDARRWGSVHTLKLVTDLTAHTIGQMRYAIYEFVGSAQDIPDLAAAFNKLINNPKRAELIAQTESTRSFAEGNTLAWKAQGIEGRKWFNVEDAAVCPICRGLGGKVAKLGAPFVDGNGHEYANPPGHPGCRCYVQPVEFVGPRPKAPAPVPTPPAKRTRKPKVVEGGAAAAPVTLRPLGALQPGDGPKVGAALVNGVRGRVGAAINKAMALIDSVHSDGALEQIPTKQTSSQTTHGIFTSRFVRGKYEAMLISVSSKATEMELTTAHEVGHWIDQQGLGGGNGWGSASAELNGWRAAVQNSAAYKNLKAASTQRTYNVPTMGGGTYAAPIDKKYMQYVLSEKELFARAYSQYIATRSNDPAMMQQVEAQRTRRNKTPNYPYAGTVWDEADFAPIADEFDKVFKARGWLKE